MLLFVFGGVLIPLSHFPLNVDSFYYRHDATVGTVLQ